MNNRSDNIGNRISDSFSTDNKLSDEYQLPEWLFKLLNSRFNFSADMACDSFNSKVKGSPFYDKEVYSLEESWDQWPGVKYVFPPFTKPYFGRFLAKAHTEWKKGESSVVIAPLKTLCVDYYQHVRAPFVLIVYPRINLIFNGQENAFADSLCILVYDAELKDNINPRIQLFDISKQRPFRKRNG